MGVYIDMEMPLSCGYCPLKQFTLKIGDDCLVGAKETEYQKRPADCPLIEVPEPHGELIDRDKLRAKEFIHDGDAYAVVMSRDIRNAPTIIPASEEGE